MGSVSGTSIDKDIHVVITAIPAWGHTRGLRCLARILAARGVPVSFITGSVYKESLGSLPGIEFVPLKGRADINLDDVSAHFPERFKLEGLERLVYDMKEVFTAPVPDQHDVVQEVLKRPELADKKVVLITDPGFLGVYPIVLDSPLARKVPIIGFGHFPVMILSKDTAPFGPGIPSQGQAVNIEMNKGAAATFKSNMDYLYELLAQYNCPKSLPSDYLIDNFYLTSDIYCQMCVPELEPERSDLPAKIRFCGSLNGGNTLRPAPEWVADYIHDTSGHPLILVTQGTITGQDPHDLIIPTIEACRDLPVRLLVCSVQLALPEGYAVPPNTRVADWVPFEDVFPVTSVVVTNGGYGGINQALGAGCPMVVSGVTEDKTETTLRAEMTGAAINLRAKRVEAEKMKEALLRVLNEPSFKENALRIKASNARHDAAGSVFAAIEEAAANFYDKK